MSWQVGYVPLASVDRDGDTESVGFDAGCGPASVPDATHVRNLNLTAVATYAYVNPVVAVLFRWLILGETLATGEWIGLLVVFRSVAIVVSAKPRRRIVSTASTFGDSTPDPIAVQPCRF